MTRFVMVLLVAILLSAGVAPAAETYVRLATDAGEFPIMDVRLVTLDTADATD